MNNSFKSIALTALSLAVFTVCSCNDWLNGDGKSQGSISLRFSEDVSQLTKAVENIPDTNDFLLNVSDSRGNALYNGRYGDCPEKLLAGPGNYNVSIRSCEFSKPGFSTPQYGDDQVVVVTSGQDCGVVLTCVQVNSGVRLKVAPEFLSAYPDGTLHLKSTDGNLLFSYNEKRVAYFRPGAVSLVLSRGAKDETLFTRSLESRQILTINISVSASNGGSLSVQLDTSRIWLSEDYVIGENSGKGQDSSSAIGIAEARSRIGESGIWVTGYIVGGDLTSSNASFSAPFSSRTNILLGSRSSTSEKSAGLSVQLQKGAIRDALNLVDNPDLLGSQIYLKGDIVASYYGIPGIQSITEYQLK